MKRRTICKWTLGVSLTILSFAATRTGAAAETAPPAAGDNPATLVANEQPATADASVEEPAPVADTDAPAKLVSNEKPVPRSIRPSGPVAEVIKLADSGLGESVMLAFVTNSTHTFNLAAEEIIYLNDIGVPGSVVTAMIQRDQALRASLSASVSAPPPYSTPPGPTDSSQLSVNGPTVDQVAPQPMDGQPYPAEAPLVPPDAGADGMFYDSLSPYGNWVDVEGYGRCWQPTVVVASPGWQPYFDCGHWIYSDCGWYWLSDYSWGWAPFHYGCWFRHEHLGWCWVPGRVWGPSWVSWRYNDHYCGWAPLPPGATFAAGIGLTFHGHRVGEGDDLGLRPGHYHFVAWDHFHDRQLRPGSLQPRQGAQVYNNSTSVTRISGDGQTVINNGLPPSRVAAATHRPIQTVALRDIAEPVAMGGRAERFGPSGHTLAVYRPNPALASPLQFRQSGTGFQDGPRALSGQLTPPAAAPLTPRGGSNRRSSNDPKGVERPMAQQASPLILRGPQSSALKESPPASSLVVIGRGTTSRPPAPGQPWGPAQNTVNRPVANQDPQQNWRGTTSTSPEPAWFGEREVTAPAPVSSASTPLRPQWRGYQAAPRMPSADVPRYAPSPSYFPQRSYAPASTPAPASSPSFQARPAPSAPSVQSAGSYSSHSSSPTSSGKSQR